VELIGEYLRLEKKGNNYVALCPFHQEKTPSFSVSPDKQLYYCFGCGEGGDHFKFVMKMENLTFPDAMELLARKTGVTLPDKNNNKTKESITEKLFELNDLAMRYFHYVLQSTKEGQKARDYLKNRGFTLSSIEEFKLGFAPSEWDAFLEVANKKGYSRELMLKGGLIASRSDGRGHYDRFRNRLMFPIMDLRGRVVGFGGRVLQEAPGTPKYLNSPETPLFDKGRYLYGIYQAKDALRQQREALIVEGYTDVIALYQGGVRNVVATLGTALTPMQAKQLRQQVEKAIMAFDADDGGRSATLRGLNILINSGLKIKVAEIPQGKDPDTVLKEIGAKAFQELIGKALPFLDYQIKQLKEKYHLDTAEGKNQFGREFLVLLNNFAGDLEKEHYIKQVAEELAISEEVLRLELKKIRDKKRSSEKKSNNLNINGKNNIIREHVFNPAEEFLLKLLLCYEGVFERIDELERTSRKDGLQFFSKEMQKIIEACRILRENGENVRVASLLNCIDEEELIQNYLTRAAFAAQQWGELSEEEVRKMTDDCIRKVKKTSLKNRRSNIEAEIKKREQSGDSQKVKELLYEWEKLNLAERELGLEKEGWTW